MKNEIFFYITVEIEITQILKLLKKREKQKFKRKRMKSLLRDIPEGDRE